MNEGEPMGMPGVGGMSPYGGSPEGRPSAMGQQRSNWLLPVVVVLVVAGLWYMQTGAMSAKVPGTWQAVFLTNNQVYFGQASDLNKQYVNLKDVYYLQLQQPNAGQQLPRQTKDQQPQFTLLKLGQEIHGPMSEMWINRDQILLIEGLRDDSKVVKTIADSKKQEEKAAPSAGTGDVKTPVIPPTK